MFGLMIFHRSRARAAIIVTVNDRESGRVRALEQGHITGIAPSTMKNFSSDETLRAEPRLSQSTASCHSKRRSCSTTPSHGLHWSGWRSTQIALLSQQTGHAIICKALPRGWLPPTSLPNSLLASQFANLFTLPLVLSSPAIASIQNCTVLDTDHSI